MRRAGVRTFAEAENYEADRKRRGLEEGGARGDRAHARHRGRADEDDPAILAQVKYRLACMRSSRGAASLHVMHMLMLPCPLARQDTPTSAILALVAKYICLNFCHHAHRSAQHVCGGSILT